MNPSPFQIRRAVESDSPALAGIFTDARARAFHWMDPAAFDPSDFAIQTEGEVVYLAEEDRGRALGFISVWRLERFIHHLYVDPDHQRQGIGAQLLRSLDSWLPRPYRLKCLVANAPARRFYQKHGWCEKHFGTDALGDYVAMEFEG